MQSFDEAWKDWLSTDNKYAIQDRAMIKADNGRYMNTGSQQSSKAGLTPLGSEINNTAEPIQALPYLVIRGMVETNYLNLLLNPASPARPKPKRSIVAGSGTGFGPPTSTLILFSTALSKSAKFSAM